MFNMAIGYNPQIVKENLVLCLDAGDPKSYSGSGTIWYDRSGDANNGILENGVGYNSGNKGSLSFDGVNDGVLLPTSILPNQLFADNGGSWTVSCWFRFPVTPVGTRSVNASWSLVGRAGGIATAGHFILFVGSATDTTYGQYAPYKLASTIRGAVTVISPSSVNTNTYNYVALTWNGSSGSVYFNNQSPANMNIGTATQQEYTDFYIGSNIGTPTSHYYSGNIAQVSIYNRSLSQLEIRQNYNALKGRYEL
jgi:hypothetical protein